MGYIIGLTGGIASGKSTVSNYFKEKKIPVIDADEIARSVVAPNTIGLKKIEKIFGSKYIDAEGALKRKQLGELIFYNKDARKKLGVILDSEIKDLILKKTDLIKDKEKVIIWDIPLLFEKNYQDLVDYVVVVTIDPNLQIERLMARDKISRKDALAKIESQMSLSKKIPLADFIINNNGNKKQTYKQVHELLKKIERK